MSNISQSVADRIGNTPLQQLIVYAEREDLKANLLVKIEGVNPGGSVKDRAALYMIEEAEKDGKIRPGDTIIEPTSGNTGIGLAMVGRAKGYKVILTMPDTMSVERRKLLAAYGAQIVLTPGAMGMKGAIEEAERIHAAERGSVILGQFDNSANPRAHELTTGPEIWKDTDGKVDVFVAGVGTGGTITGVGRFLKSKNPDCEIVAVEPAESPVLSGGKPSSHGIQGIGAGFVPGNFDQSIVSKIITVTTADARRTAKKLAEDEGILAGVSSGAALYAATELARDPRYAGKTIIALLPDSGERYMSIGLFD